MTLWDRARGPLIVFVVAAVVTIGLLPANNESYDGHIMKQVAVSLADRNTPLVHPDDAFGLNTPYSGYGIGTSLVMSLLYDVGGLVRLDQFAMLRLANPLMYAGTAAAVFALVRRRTSSLALTIGATATIAVATPLLAYSVSDFSEPGVALCVAVGLIGLERVQTGVRWGSAVTGAAAGSAVLFRTDSILLVALPFAAALFAMKRDRWRSLLIGLATAVPTVAIWLAYNHARFDSWTTSGYGNQPFSHGLLPGLYGLLLSPGRGLFVYVPLVLLALVVTPRLSSADRKFGLLALAMVLLRALLYARWWSWYGGDTWGPRFMVPVLPALAIPVTEALRRWHRRPLALATLAASLTMSLIGLLVVIGTVRLSYRQPVVDIDEIRARDHASSGEFGDVVMREWTSDDFVDATDRVMFDWSRFPARR
jgi:hypothetical protein